MPDEIPFGVTYFHTHKHRAHLTGLENNHLIITDHSLICFRFIHYLLQDFCLKTLFRHLQGFTIQSLIFPSYARPRPVWHLGQTALTADCRSLLLWDHFLYSIAVNQIVTICLGRVIPNIRKIPDTTKALSFFSKYIWLGIIGVNLRINEK